MLMHVNVRACVNFACVLKNRYLYSNKMLTEPWEKHTHLTNTIFFYLFSTVCCYK